MTTRLTGRQLYISDLLQRLWALENGHVPMNAMSYRLLAKRLHAALAGQAPATLVQGFPELPARLLAPLLEALEARHFAEFGWLHGSTADDVRARALTLLRQLRR